MQDHAQPKHVNAQMFMYNDLISKVKNENFTINISNAKPVFLYLPEGKKFLDKNGDPVVTGYYLADNTRIIFNSPLTEKDGAAKLAELQKTMK